MSAEKGRRNQQNTYRYKLCISNLLRQEHLGCYCILYTVLWWPLSSLSCPTVWATITPNKSMWWCTMLQDKTFKPMCCTAHIPLFLVIIIYCIDNVLFPILHNLPHCAPNHVTGSIGCYCQPMTFACTDQKANRYPRLKHLSLPQMILCSHSISSELSNNWDWKAMKHTHSQVNVHLLILIIRELPLFRWIASSQRKPPT